MSQSPYIAHDGRVVGIAPLERVLERDDTGYFFRERRDDELDDFLDPDERGAYRKALFLQALSKVTGTPVDVLAHGPRRAAPRIQGSPAGGSLFEKVKAAWRIEDLAERLTDMRPASRGRLLGLCPFHAERTPSFTIWPETQTFKCFGCNVRGDVIELARLAADAGLMR